MVDPIRTRCKFTVQSVKRWSGSYEEVELTAVTGGSKENVSFSSATPSGKLTITVSNPAVVSSFTPGTDYYIDLIPAAEVV